MAAQDRDVLINEIRLENIANAIRAKNGQTDIFYTVAEMPSAIAAIETGSQIPTGTGSAASAADVLTGKEFVHSATNELMQGTMAINTNVDSSAQAIVEDRLKLTVGTSGYYGATATVNMLASELGDATAAQVLEGSFFSSRNGLYQEGTIPINNAINQKLNISTTSYTIPEGYHNGNGTVSISLQTKNATPSNNQQIINADTGYVMSSVTVDAVNLTGNASAENVLSGKTFYNTTLTKQNGTMPHLGNSAAYQYASNNTTKVLFADNIFYFNPYKISDGTTKNGYIALRYSSAKALDETNALGPGMLPSNVLFAYPASKFGNATAAQVLKGATFTSSAGVKVTGTFAPKTQTVSQTITLNAGANTTKTFTFSNLTTIYGITKMQKTSGSELITIFSGYPDVGTGDDALNIPSGGINGNRIVQRFINNSDANNQSAEIAITAVGV